MRKLLPLFLAVLFAFSFAACQPNTGNKGAVTPTPTPGITTSPGVSPGATALPGAAAYKDGTYTAEGDEWQYGKEDASVVILDGKIESISLRRLEKDGKEVNYDQWTGTEVEGKVRPNLKQFRIDMANKMVEKQSYDVDAISGATVSCDNWKIAVKRALEKAAAK